MAGINTGLKWSDHSGKTNYGVTGECEVLIIVSEDDLPEPDVVRRRPAIELTEEVRGKLENQGIPREDQCDDLSIAKARCGLDKNYTVKGVEKSQPGGVGLTRKSVLKQIKLIMNNYDGNGGVVLHYIGHGRRNTGDWCFQDGYITFTDLAQLYLQLLRGRVLGIVTDCSHSGSWVKQCMAFMDQQGVGPCGHSARDKGILITLYTTCLSHQVPRQFAYSVYGSKNDKNTGLYTATKVFHFIALEAKMADNQHGYGINFTEIRCGKQAIDEECLCLPGATWEKWDMWNRQKIILNKSMNTWRILLLVDDDETVLRFLETVQTGYIECEDYGEIVKSGHGQEPTKEDMRLAMENFLIYREEQN